MKKRKTITPVVLGAAAVVLLGLSITGAARAALIIRSDTYVAEMSVSEIGVTLNELNGNDTAAEAVAYRNYAKDANWNELQDGELLDDLLGDDESLQLGKAYKEELSVTNSGQIDSYVRVIVTKSWIRDDDKNVDLSPEMIQLDWNTDDWIVVDDNPADEEVVLYYKHPLSYEDGANVTSNLCNTLTVSPTITTKFHSESSEDDPDTVRTVYDYDGYSLQLEAEVDAVQTHNASAAITSAWGVTPTLTADDGTGDLTAIYDGVATYQ